MTHMALAERFGRADVDAFLASLGSSRITEWLMYFKINQDEAENRRAREGLRRRVKRKKEGKVNA